MVNGDDVADDADDGGDADADADAADFGDDDDDDDEEKTDDDDDDDDVDDDDDDDLHITESFGCQEPIRFLVDLVCCRIVPFNFPVSVSFDPPLHDQQHVC